MPTVVVAVVYGGAVTELRPFSIAATAAVLGGGVVSMALGASRRRRAEPPDVGSRVPWIVVAGALGGWQLAAYLQHPRSEHPTLSSLINAALDPRPVRAVAFACWMAAGAWLARR